MRTTLEDSSIDERTDAKSDVDAASIREEINEALKRMEKGLNESQAALSETLEEGKISAERILRRGRHVADTYLDDAMHQIKHNPQAAIALAFGVGAVAGVLFGLLAPRGKSKGMLTSSGADCNR
jgi:hypothetical protein